MGEGRQLEDSVVREGGRHAFLDLAVSGAPLTIEILGEPNVGHVVRRFCVINRHCQRLASFIFRGFAEVYRETKNLVGTAKSVFLGQSKTVGRR